MDEARDPYNAVFVWLFGAERDPERFLQLFEGVVPNVRGMEWIPSIGWICVPENVPTNMIWDGALATADPPERRFVSFHLDDHDNFPYS